MTTATTYRELRALGYRATDALHHARWEEALQAAEESGRVRVRVEWDDDPIYPEHTGADDRWAQRYFADLEAGRIINYVVVVEERCAACHRFDVVGSLSSVDIYDDAAGWAHVRDCARELARDAGLI